MTNVTVKTFHGLGLSFVKSVYPKTRIDNDKIKNIFTELGRKIIKDFETHSKILLKNLYLKSFDCNDIDFYEE